MSSPYSCSVLLMWNGAVPLVLSIMYTLISYINVRNLFNKFISAGASVRRTTFHLSAIKMFRAIHFLRVRCRLQQSESCIFTKHYKMSGKITYAKTFKRSLTLMRGFIFYWVEENNAIEATQPNEYVLLYTRICSHLLVNREGPLCTSWNAVDCSAAALRCSAPSISVMTAFITITSSALAGRE